jgi:arylmalonate decarboxylase
MVGSSAVVRALRTIGARRVALATAYTDEVNTRLIGFLEAEGFDIAAVKDLAMTDVVGVGDVTPDTLTALAQEVFAQAGTAQAVLIHAEG